MRPEGFKGDSLALQNELRKLCVCLCVWLCVKGCVWSFTRECVAFTSSQSCLPHTGAPLLLSSAFVKTEGDVQGCVMQQKSFSCPYMLVGKAAHCDLDRLHGRTDTPSLAPVQSRSVCAYVYVHINVYMYESLPADDNPAAPCKFSFRLTFPQSERCNIYDQCILLVTRKGCMSYDVTSAKLLQLHVGRDSQ